MRSSESIAALAAALVAAQGEMPNVPKETVGQVGSAKRNYADLATVTETARPIMAEHGLAWVQGLSGGSDGAVTVTTRIVHTSGEWIEDSLHMPTGQGPQAVGSACTYGRRYSLMAMLGLAPDDDDGAAAQAAHRPAQPVADAPSVAVHRRLKTVVKGSPKAEEIKRLAEQHGEKLTVEGLEKDSWRSVVEGVLDNAALSGDAPVESEVTP